MSNEITPEIKEELKNRYEAAKAGWDSKSASVNPAPSITTSQEAKSATKKPSKKGWSIFFLILAINFAIGGCNVAYKDAEVVGGDAYNYIIGAGRGIAVVGVGVVCGLIAVILAVYDLTNVIVHYNKKEE